MRNFLIWALVGICGLGLIFDGQIRNDYYSAFSYLFPTNTKQYQDLADTTRLVIGLAMALSVFNVFGGLLLKVLSIIGFVVYSVVINQDFLVNPSSTKLKEIASVGTHIILLFLCMDSIIGQILQEQTKSEREKTKKAVEAAKKQAEKVAQQSQKNQKEKPAASSGKGKGQEEAKQQKKEQKGNQKQKKH